MESGAESTSCPHSDSQQQQQQQTDQQQRVVAGQVTYRRRLSSKLVFYDVLQSGPASQCWWEVVVKTGVYGTTQDVKDLRDTVKLGDIVEATGWLECQHHNQQQQQQQHPVLQATQVRVTQPWQAQHTGIAFSPQPAPKAAPGQQQHIQAPAQQPLQQQQQQQRACQDEQPQEQKQQQQHSNSARSAAGSAPPEHPTQAAAAPQSPLPDTSSPVHAKVTAPQLPVCKFWVNTGRCSKGADCPYLHALLQATAGRRNWLDQRLTERQQRAAEKGFVHNSSAAAKRQRAAVFAAWLVQQYGKARLNTGAGVLDVAGGSGSLTFELAHVHGVKCTLVDPRPLKLNKHQHRQLQEAGRGAEVRTLTLQQHGEATAPAASLQQPCQQRYQQAVQQGDVQDMFGALELQQQLGLLGSGVTQQHAGPASLLGDQSQQMLPGTPSAPLQLQQVQACFGPELWGTAGWQQLFQGCSVVVGLHPDQATEPILDFALQHHLPFAVMPCCVFPRLFPQRRLQLEGGGAAVPVVDYSQLVAYLVQRGGGQRAVLDFEGANTVVYR